MNTKSANPAGDAAAIALELVHRISAISTIPDLASPQAMLENAARFVAPVLPADASLKPLRRALLRILRIVTRDQTAFNSAILEALRWTLEKTEDRVRALEQSLLEASENAVKGRYEALQRTAEREELLATLRETLEATRTLRFEWTGVRRDLQERTASLSIAPEAAPIGTGPTSMAGLERAGLYADFQSSLHGSEEEIRARRRLDISLFVGAPGPVANLGCGRGEFLEEARTAGLDAIGCDLDPVSVARARKKGLSVDPDDPIRWLGTRPDGSLGGIAAYRLVERIGLWSLFDLVELAVAKLAPGGRLLLETINPESVYTMQWFWIDPAHVRPVPAAALARLMTVSGLKEITVDYRSPVAEAGALPVEAARNPAFTAIARVLFAPREYAVTGLR